MLKRIIEKVVVLEGGRGVKCVVKREDREGRAAMLMQDVACAGVPIFAVAMLKFCLVSPAATSSA